MMIHNYIDRKLKWSGTISLISNQFFPMILSSCINIYDVKIFKLNYLDKEKNKFSKNIIYFVFNYDTYFSDIYSYYDIHYKEILK
jgi:hypothetical protein